MLLVTGSRGQLGRTLCALLPHAVAPGSDELDITDADAVRDFVRSRDIDVIVNCAAYTMVDKAEDEPESAERINAGGPANLAKSGAAIVHISTDYVFDGTSTVPYREEDAPNPVSVYGRTKLLGEKAVFEYASTAIVIRTSWLYSPHGANFVKTMLRLGAERECVRVVADQVGTPTSCLDLAKAIAGLLPRIRSELSGVYHYSNEGMCSWHDFAEEIFRRAGVACRVEPIASGEYPTRATRPHFSVLDKAKFKSTFAMSIPHWEESLHECLGQF